MALTYRATVEPSAFDADVGHTDDIWISAGHGYSSKLFILSHLHDGHSAVRNHRPSWHHTSGTRQSPDLPRRGRDVESLRAGRLGVLRFSPPSSSPRRASDCRRRPGRPHPRLLPAASGSSGLLASRQKRQCKAPAILYRSWLYRSLLISVIYSSELSIVCRRL